MVSKKEGSVEIEFYISTISAIGALVFTEFIPFMQLALDEYASPNAIISPFGAFSLQRYFSAESVYTSNFGIAGKICPLILCYGLSQ